MSWMAYISPGLGDLDYRKVSNIRCTKFQNLSDSRPALQLSLLFAQSIEAMY